MITRPFLVAPWQNFSSVKTSGGQGDRPLPKSPKKKTRSPKQVLALPGLEQSKTAVLNSLTSKSGPRSRRTPSASGRKPWAASRVHRRASRSAPFPANAASGWRPFLRARTASVASSCALSFTLAGERLLHFQLNRNNDHPAYLGCAAASTNYRELSRPNSIPVSTSIGCPFL